MRNGLQIATNLCVAFLFGWIWCSEVTGTNDDHFVFKLPQQVEFVINRRTGHLLSGRIGKRQILRDCVDEYWLQTETDEIVMQTDEQKDIVISVKKEKNRIVLDCRNELLGLALKKIYAPASVPQALRKTVIVQSCRSKGALHIFSKVKLAENFSQGAWIYTPRQSWGGQRLLYGVRRLSDITVPITSSSGWDNRFVVAFLPDRSVGFAHWRSLVDNLWVPSHGVIAEWGRESPFALTYFSDGWRWRLLHTVDGERSSASCDYVLLRGDWYDAWGSYLRMPELQQTYQHIKTTPIWCPKIKYGTFWRPVHHGYEEFHQAAKETLAILSADAQLTIGVFAWSLDGDYETDRPFLMETLEFVFTPQWLRNAVSVLQRNPRSKVGLYIQGGLIDSESECYRKHPDWVIRDQKGQPIPSGFSDNAVGVLFMANPRVDEWVQHHIERIKAVCRVYDCGFIYLDGGGYGELIDWSRRHAINFAHCRRLNERVFEAVRSTGKDRGLLINSQNMPFADISWVECGYFAPHVPWRETVDFCFDTKCQQVDPRYTLEPLYWQDNDRYLAMCIAFGFTPCGEISPEKPEATWRAIEAAYRMKQSRLIYRSDATSPVWWRDEVPIVTFAVRLGKEIIVPILNFGDRQDLTVTVNLEAVGLQTTEPVEASLYQPLLSAEKFSVKAAVLEKDKISFRLKVPVGWKGITLLSLKQ
ncbi:MAG: hypothetical protein NZ959_07725 [Armatimonadetes bacterium]|nr:hypothetical protein [Armatimonadota bacterium]MDW8121673.1 hypothetical protein [Armatimonadota bacterium]